MRRLEKHGYSVMSFSHGQSGHLSGYDLMIWRCVTEREVTAVRLDFLRPVRAGSFELPVSLPESNVIGQKERDRPIVLSTTLQDGNECRNSGRFLMPCEVWGSWKAG
jgi:hypothetical protein